MKNGLNFFNKNIKSHSSRHYRNIYSARKSSNIHKKVFLNKAKLQKNEERNINKRYINNYDNYNSISDINNKKYINLASPSYSKYDWSSINNSKRKNIYKSIEINKANHNEKSLMVNNNLLVYNEIIILLDDIMDTKNSYDILVKIRNFITAQIFGNNKKLGNSESCKNFWRSNDSIKFLTSKNKNVDKIMFNNDIKDKNKENIENEKKENKDLKKADEVEDKASKDINNSRRMKKLYNKINQLEKKSNIEQLKYLFFIVEQEKKIAELEKNFELKEIPLDQRLIEKMKELKCYPEFIRKELDSKKEKKVQSTTDVSNTKNSTLIKSRNKIGSNNKYSFDKEIEPITKKHQSLIIDKSDNKIKSRKFQFSQKKINFNNNKVKDNNNKVNINNDNKIKKIIINFNKPVNQLFDKKNFFITHPKLNYVKNSMEKNHFLKLKAKEQLSGDTKLLSKMNIASKSQKNAVNDFSSFINNSMINFDRFKS